MAANPWANMPPLPASAAPADTTTASPLRSSITAHAAPLASSAGHLPLHQPETGAADRILALAQASGHLAPGERALAFDSSAAVAGSASALSARTLAACVRLDQFHVERDRVCTGNDEDHAEIRSRGLQRERAQRRMSGSLL